MPAPTTRLEAVPAPPPPTPTPKLTTSRLLAAGAGGVVVIALVMAWWLFAPASLAPAPSSATAPDKAIRTTISFDPVVVNLAGESRRYLRVGVSLAVTAPGETRAIQEAKSQLLDLIISVFSSAAADSVMTDSGRAEVKKALLTRMRNDLKLRGVAQIYFTEFVIQ